MTPTTTTSTASRHLTTTGTFGRLSIAITVLATATALVHLYLGVITTNMVVSDPALTATLGGATALSIMAALFYLSFVGYVVLNVAMYLPALHRFHRLARWGLITWAAGNLVAYVALAGGHVDAFGVADKACELALIALLVVEGRRVRASVG
jgi:hypothetical protein